MAKFSLFLAIFIKKKYILYCMRIHARGTPLSFERSVGRKIEYGVRIKRPIYLQILFVQ